MDFGLDIPTPDLLFFLEKGEKFLSYMSLCPTKQNQAQEPSCSSYLGHFPEVIKLLGFFQHHLNQISARRYFPTLFARASSRNRHRRVDLDCPEALYAHRLGTIGSHQASGPSKECSVSTRSLSFSLASTSLNHLNELIAHLTNWEESQGPSTHKALTFPYWRKQRIVGPEESLDNEPWHLGNYDINKTSV